MGSCSRCVGRWWWTLVLVLASSHAGNSQTPPSTGLYFMLNGNMLLPGSSVLITDIGRFTDADPEDAGGALVCVTSSVNTQCCRGMDGGNVGEWHFPDGTIVPRNSNPGDSAFSRSGFSQQVRLNRVTDDAVMPVGEYECRVPDPTNIVTARIILEAPPTTPPITTAPPTAPPTIPTTAPPPSPTTPPPTFAPTTSPSLPTTAPPTTAAPTTAAPTGLYFLLGEDTYMDGAEVSLLALSTVAKMGPLICATGNVNTECCRSDQTSMGGAIGEWFYNGEKVVNLADSGENNLYRNRDLQQVVLNVKDMMLAVGTYRCAVPDSRGNTVTATIIITNDPLVETTTAPPSDGGSTDSTAVTTTTTPGMEGSGNVGVAVGVVIVLVLLVVAVVVLVVFILLWWRRNKQKLPYDEKLYRPQPIPLRKIPSPPAPYKQTKNGHMTPNGEELTDNVGGANLQPIPVLEFGGYVADLHSNNNKGFIKQYASLSSGEQHHTTAISSVAENRLKNRFGNILVYDDNLIVLEKCPERCVELLQESSPDAPHLCNDYINASYIDGYSVSQRFIASQGPLPKTVLDFWRMVWQERPPTVVMVTNLKEGMRVKCQEYWPSSGHLQVGPYRVAITEQQVLADYALRTFSLQREDCTGSPLKVRQYHFTAWPDHGVPDYATPLLAFLRRVRSEHASRAKGRSPILVHCSAGVGRTGTLIALDIILDQIAKEGVVDVGGVVERMRTQRMNMVQTEEQYVFIHDAVLEWLTCGDTQITPTNLRMELVKLDTRSPDTNITGYEKQFKVLEQVSPQPDKVECKIAQANSPLNRRQEFLPPDRWRAILRGVRPDYIHAITVHGYKHQRAYLVGQTPLPSTLRNYYQLVFDRMVSCIVQLTAVTEGGKEVCAQYWPSSQSQHREKRFEEFTVEWEKEEKLEGYIVRTFSLSKDKYDAAHQLTQFHITCWDGNGMCSNLKAVIDVIDEVSRIQRRTGNKPIMVTCNDTVTRSALFCAIATTIERCKTESVVDIFQVVKALRVHRPGAVRTVEQYKLIFEALLVFLDSFDNYANFH